MEQGKDPRKSSPRDPIYDFMTPNAGRYNELPVVRTPLTPFMSKLFPIAIDIGKGCDQLERGYYRCVDAYGFHAAKTKCTQEDEDLIECKRGVKQLLRFHAMRQERERQQREFLPVETDYIYTEKRL